MHYKFVRYSVLGGPLVPQVGPEILGVLIRPAHFGLSTAR
jgi:hypothetical protein